MSVGGADFRAAHHDVQVRAHALHGDKRRAGAQGFVEGGPVVVHAALAVSEVTTDVALPVDVDQQHAGAIGGDQAREVGGQCRLADSALPVGDDVRPSERFRDTALRRNRTFPALSDKWCQLPGSGSTSVTDAR